MEAEHRSAQRELLMLMGLAGATDAWRVEAVSEIKDPLEPPAEEDRLVAVATEQRLDLKAAEWQAQSAASNIKLMTREALWFPGLAVGLGLERSPAPPSNNPKLLGTAGNGFFSGAMSQALGMPMNVPMGMPFSPKMREVEWTFGPMFEMRLPIFDQGQGRIGRSVYDYRQRVAEYETRFQELTRMVRDSLVMYRQAYEQVRFYRESIVPEVERNLQLAQQSYVAGQENLTIFLQVQEDLIYFRESQIQRAELERQVGGTLVLSAAATQPAAQTQPAATK
jgi:outer membrane protein TolC